MNLDEVTKKLKSRDPEVFDEGFFELYQQINDIDYRHKKVIMSELDLTPEERIRFFITAPYRCKDKVHLNFRVEVVPYLLTEYIAANEDEFFKTIEENRELQRGCALFESENGDFDSSLYPRLFQLEEFKTNILNNSEVIAARYSTNTDFFESLPEEYSYLVALFAVRRRGESILHRLYEQKFSDLLSEEDILMLEETHFEINTRPNPFELSTDVLMLEFEYCLKHILEEPDYLEALKTIVSKTGLNLETVMKFASRYDNTALFKDIYNRDQISSELVEKIKYLSSVGKVKEDLYLYNIDLVSLDRLKEAEKEDTKVIKLNIRGGPRSTTREYFFDGGYDREVYSIDTSGEMERLPVSYSKNHEDTVQDIYRNSIDFPFDCTTAIDRSVYAAKELSSTTLVIEREMCFLIMPKELTEEQLNTLTGILETANTKGVVGIITYDKGTNKSEIEFNGGCVSPQEAINHLSEIDVNYMKKSA